MNGLISLINVRQQHGCFEKELTWLRGRGFSGFFGW
jgi:hypothetical protein